MHDTDRDALLLGTCTFEPGTLTLRDAAGVILPVRAQSLRVLAALARSRGQVVSRDSLVDEVWHGIAVTDDSLVQCIKDIRAAIGDGERRIVRTVIGQGYALSARTAGETAGTPPKIFIERFGVGPESPVAEELREALFEELIVRFSPRVGITIVTDPELRQTADYVISGRASARGDRARLFVRISRASGGEIHAGAEEADGEEIWDLPARAADKIAAQLRIRMLMSDGEPHVSRDNAELSPQELMAKATWHMSRFRRENWYAATEALRLAAERAPDNPIAIAMLASMHTQMILHVPFSELPGDVDRAMALAERAVELGQSIDYVLRTRATLRLWRLGDHAGARLDCARALEINPVFHLTHLTIAASEVLSGEYDAGTQRLQEMMRRAPVDSQNPFYFALIALSECLAGRMDTALAAAREGSDRFPNGPWNALVYAAVAADEPSVTGSPEFRRRIGLIDLPVTHFQDMPFTDPAAAAWLVERARRAGVGTEDGPARVAVRPPGS
ncbi:hypothetical protein HKCCE3408_17400 [Rhodobacterales bacterium HKCCE3408]|nr:hypothetical protein [Rhodobacterales bacterium HKCCE3408]